MILINHSLYYPTRINSNFYTIFSFLLIVLVLFQVLTGILLFLFFDTNSQYTFCNLILFVRNINYAWLLKSFHEINSNIIFILIYLHIFKNLYYKSYTYNNYLKWMSGFILYILMIIICFIGYVLPWGQMSYWAATVIINLLSILPYGNAIVYFIWGGLNVNYFTLIRFGTLHFLLALILLLLILIHIKIVHYNITKVNSFFKVNTINYVSLYNFTIKDLTILILITCIIIFLICFYPEFFSNPVNLIPANSLETPKHIIPEWYLIWLYGILKLIPNKVIGILSLLLIFILIILIPFLFDKNISCFFTNFIFLVLVDIGFYPITNKLYTILFYLFIIFLLIYLFYLTKYLIFTYNKRWFEKV